MNEQNKPEENAGTEKGTTKEVVDAQAGSSNQPEEAKKTKTAKPKKAAETETKQDEAEEQKESIEQPKPQPPGGVLNEEESKEEYKRMGKDKKWVCATIVSRKLKYGNPTPKRFTFTKNHLAMIYRGDTFLRFAPFLAKNDIESDQSWAEFSINDFYGKGRSPWPWDWATIKILWMPLNKSADFCETLGGGGFLIKVDESAKCQMPMRIKLPPDEIKKILMNNRMVGQALLLKATLTNYEKPKTNWDFWLIIGVVVLGSVIIWALWQIGFLQGFLNWIAGIAKGFAPPNLAHK